VGPLQAITRAQSGATSGWHTQRLSTEWIAALQASAEDGEGAELPAVAIDGKSVRGAAAGGNPRPHLLSAATHDGAIVIA